MNQNANEYNEKDNRTLDSDDDSELDCISEISDYESSDEDIYPRWIFSNSRIDESIIYF